MTAPADLETPRGFGLGSGLGFRVGLGRRAGLRLTTHALHKVLCRALLHIAGAQRVGVGWKDWGFGRVAVWVHGQEQRKKIGQKVLHAVRIGPLARKQTSRRTINSRILSKLSR